VARLSLRPEPVRLSRASGSLLGSALICCALFAPAATARAEVNLDSARVLYANADFAGTLVALDRAERAPMLTRAELGDLLALRAVTHFALRDAEACAGALAELAGVAPEHEWNQPTPPALLEAWAEARAHNRPPAITLRVRNRVGALEVAPRLEARLRDARGGAARLVRFVRVYVLAADGSISRAGVDTVEVPRELAARGFEAYAEALGPGGVVLARAGNSSRPRRMVPPPAAASPEDAALRARLDECRASSWDAPRPPTSASANALRDEAASGPALEWWIGAAAVAVGVGVLTAVVTAAVVSTGSGSAVSAPAAISESMP